MAYIGQSVKVKRVRYTPQSSIPSNASEGDSFYSDGTASAEGLYVYKNSAWIPVGSSASGINYITNPDAESATTGWATYDDGASTIPVNGTAGSPSTLTLSRNTSSPLRGVADLKLAKSAADGQGEGLSFDFTIDSADTTSILNISFDYKVTANYADNDIQLFIYDVTNSSLIYVSNQNIKASTQTEKHFAAFQTSTSTSYRLILHVASTNATAYDLNIDNVIVGPAAKSITIPSTDWISYIPSDTSYAWGTATVSSAHYRRLGKQIFGTINLSITSAVSANLRLESSEFLPPGLSVDTSAPISYASVWSAIDASAASTANNAMGCGFVSQSTGQLFLYGSDTTEEEVDATFPFTWASGDAINISYVATISGWDTTMIVADEYSGRDIYVEGRGNGGTGITANVTDLIFTEVSDNTSSWNGSQFTAPSSDWYEFNGSIKTTTSLSHALYAYIDTVQTDICGLNTAAAVTCVFSGRVYLNKGQVLSFRSDQSGTLSNSSTTHFLKINRGQKSKNVGLEEKVFARCSGNAASASAGNPVIFPTSDFDSHSAYSTSTGLYTVPVSGVYRVSGFVESANTAVLLNVCKNGTTDVAAGVTDSNGEGIFTTLVNATAGQTISLEPSNTLDITSGHMAIEKI